MQNKSSTKLAALIFDVDGTLADTEHDAHLPAFNLAFAEFGLDWHWDDALYGELLRVTGGKERLRHYLQRFHPDSQFRDDFLSSVHQAKTRHYNRMLSEGKIPLRRGVKRLLLEARNADLRLAIATTTSPENVMSLLRYSLAEDAPTWFDVIAAGDIVPAKKPAPDIYLWALKELGLDATQCLAFEDSENGLKSALGAGLRTIITTNGYTSAQDFSGAVTVLSDLGEPTDNSHVDMTLLLNLF
ncbi:MAG: HAD family hydrolase [Methylophilales bacterium]|nr:HAD family hydrolase [Methylophilales bacterium]